MTAHLQPAPCCQHPPMLRVRPQLRAGLVISYVQYECQTCGNRSGLAITENEAWSYWQPANRPASHPTPEP